MLKVQQNTFAEGWWKVNYAPYLLIQNKPKNQRKKNQEVYLWISKYVVILFLFLHFLCILNVLGGFYINLILQKIF